jgi:hypothetical protein
VQRLNDNPADPTTEKGEIKENRENSFRDEGTRGGTNLLALNMSANCWSESGTRGTDRGLGEFIVTLERSRRI